MSKSQHSTRETKKKPLMTAKERRMAKHAKKHEQETPSLLHETPPQVTH
jgi:hypothetical protein